MSVMEEKCMSVAVLTIRDVREDDAEALVEIYAPYVIETAISYEYIVPSVEEFRQRIGKTLRFYPYICAQDGERILGYAYAGSLHEREAYKHSVELSIYVRRGFHGRGIGKRLYKELEQRLRERGFTALYACIAATLRQDDAYLSDASLRFHARMGYHQAGYFSRCAKKFGLVYDMVYMEKHLESED